MSKLRVAERVAHGGHNIAAKVIERRFARSLRNLRLDYSQTADACQCFLNNTEPVLIFEQQGAKRNILHENLYQQLLNEAGL